MKSEEFFNRLSNLILKDKIGQVIQELHELYKGSDKLKEVIIQSARHKDLMKHINLGAIDYTDAAVEKGKIKLALMDLIENLGNNVSENEQLEGEMEKVIKGSDLILAGLKAQKIIEVKIKQKKSKATIIDLESKHGKINIDIEQE